MSDTVFFNIIPARQGEPLHAGTAQDRPRVTAYERQPRTYNFLENTEAALMPASSTDGPAQRARRKQ